MTDNVTRVVRADTALHGYIEARGEVYEGSISEIGDLIADLLHLAATISHPEEGPRAAIRLGQMHFDAEHENPEEQ